MSVIQNQPGHAYGTGIAAMMSDLTGREVSDAQVFVGLRRLERQGLIASVPDPNSEPSERTRGRPRKFYELTASGKRALEAAGAYTTLASADQRSARRRNNGREEEDPDIAAVVA